MDEILIADQKYVSSKRAAEITGYAKDYVGQLCREGRVEARLVGRNWYVREAAIRDHRFNTEDAVEAPKLTTERRSDDLPSAWKAPVYSTEDANFLPPVSHIQPEPATPTPQTQDSAQDMQTAWQEWFTHKKQQPATEEESAPEPVLIEEEPTSPPEEEMKIHINRLEEEPVEAEPILEPEVEMIEEAKPIMPMVLETRPVRGAKPRASIFASVLLLLIAIGTIGISLLAVGAIDLSELKGIPASVHYITGSTVISK